jgi:ferric-dicitrate binding protein FerR (iron transport regulator)
MSSTYREIARGTDRYGTPWQVGTDEGALTVTLYGASVDIDGAEKERFAEAVARAVTPGQRVNHGPACNCTPCLAEPSYRARREAND